MGSAKLVLRASSLPNEPPSRRQQHSGQHDLDDIHWDEGKHTCLQDRSPSDIMCQPKHAKGVDKDVANNHARGGGPWFTVPAPLAEQTNDECRGYEADQLATCRTDQLTDARAYPGKDRHAHNT